MMKNTFLAALLGCTALLQAQTATNEMAIRAFTQAYMAAYNREDLAALKAMYTAGAVCILDDNDNIKGAEAIAAHFEDLFIRYAGTLLMRHIDLRWSDAQQAWVAVGTYEGYGASYVYDIPYHDVTAYANTMVEEDGRWKIARSEVTPLVRTLVYQDVKDFGEWKSTLLGLLHNSSVLTHETGVLQNAPRTAYALLQWSSLEAAQEFFARPGWQNTFRRVSASKGKPPVVMYFGGK